MQIDLPTEPFGTTIFCDEIRQEVNGKLMFLGVYQSEMIFKNPFPQTVGRLAACAIYTEPLSMEAAPIKLRADLIEGEAGDGATATSIFRIEFGSRPAAAAHQDSSIATLNFLVDMPPFTVKAPSLLRLYVERGERRLQIGTLKINARSAPLKGNKEELPQ